MSEFVTARIEVQETAATIAADRRFVENAVDAIKAARQDVERQIRKDRFFLATLEPYDTESCSSEVTKRMCDAARLAGVGPMAAVAGAIAQTALEAMVNAGCRHGWVDNGGDIALILESPATLEIFSKPGSTAAYAFNVQPVDRIMGICSSSGRIGHSISFGDSDVAVAIAEDAIVADALATALGNRVKNKESLETCFDDLKSIGALKGGLVMIDDSVAMYGDVPKLIEVEHNPDRLTVHSSMSSHRFIAMQGATQELRA